MQKWFSLAIVWECKQCWIYEGLPLVFEILEVKRCLAVSNYNLGYIFILLSLVKRWNRETDVFKQTCHSQYGNYVEALVRHNWQSAICATRIIINVTQWLLPVGEDTSLIEVKTRSCAYLRQPFFNNTIEESCRTQSCRLSPDFWRSTPPRRPISWKWWTLTCCTSC